MAVKTYTVEEKYNISFESLSTGVIKEVLLTVIVCQLTLLFFLSHSVEIPEPF